MSFNTDILLANYYTIHSPNNDNKDDNNNNNNKEQYIQSDTEQKVFTKPPRPRFARYGLDIIKASNYQAYKTYRKIRNSYKKEEFSRNYEKVIQGFYRKYNKKRKGGLGLNRSFTTVKKNN